MAWQGGNDKIAELLKQACPPAAASPEFKANLRLQVNQQAAALGAATPKPLWQQPFVWIPAAAACAVAAALILFFVVFQSVPPTVITSDATGIQATSATLNGKLDGLGSDDSAKVSFEWGVTTDYGNETTPEFRKVTGSFEAKLTGLAPNTTYHFRVKAVGSSGTAYGPDMQFTTRPTPLVTTNDATSEATTSATLNGDLTSLGTARSVTVSFEWGTTSGSYTYTTAGQARTSTGTFSADLSGLDPGTTYYFRAKAVGGGDPVYGEEKSFTTLTTPPLVTTNDATDVAMNSATLNGDLTSLGTAGSVTVSFEWGTVSGSYTSTTADQTRTSTGAFSADLSGLGPGTTYYFRAKAVGDGDPVYGPEKRFTTLTIPPSVETIDASNVAVASATLNGNLISLGTAESVTVSFEWGTTGGSYTYTTADQARTNTGTFSADLSGLDPGTTYYFRAKAVGDGDPVYGEEKSFTTSTTPPAARTRSATEVRCTSATLNGTLDSMGTAESVEVSFQWGTTTAYDNETAGQIVTVTGSFNASLTGLSPRTTYHFRAKADGDGDPVYGDDIMFTTGRMPPAQKTWYLSADDNDPPQVMYDGDTSKSSDIIQLSSWGLTSLIWRADQSSSDTQYPAGNWLFQLMLSHFKTSHTDNIEIGTWDGSTFTSYGVYSIHGLGQGNEEVYRVSDNISVGSFTVPSEGYVAVRITVTSSQLLNIHVGGEDSFVRSPSYPEPTAPTVATAAATGLEQTTAVLNGYLDNLGSAGSATVYFEWGTTTAYGNEIEVGSLASEGSFSLAIADLIPNTTYHFRAKVVGDGTNYGIDMTFTTPP
jgi:phosphodiesterase/alkaline phosphatase D-like protein